MVFDNYRAGVLKRLGLDFERLKLHNPRIISCSITGFGEEGPYRDRPAYDVMVQAISGAMSLTGEEGRPPVRMGISIADHAAGMFAAIGILSAVVARNETGEGQRVDVSLLDGMISLLSYEGAVHLFSGEVPQPRGSGHITNVPYQAFPTKDSHIVVAVRGNTFWREFCTALKIGEVADDPRFATPAERLRNKKEILKRIEEILATKTTAEWEKILVEHGVPCGPVNALDRSLADPQVLARRMVVKCEGKSEGPSFMGNPVKIQPSAGERYVYPPKLGANTDEVLNEILGYPGEKIESLRKMGVIK